MSTRRFTHGRIIAAGTAASHTRLVKEGRGETPYREQADGDALVGQGQKRKEVFCGFPRLLFDKISMPAPCCVYKPSEQQRREEGWKGKEKEKRKESYGS